MLSPHFHPLLIEAGCDEAGRGCLAGPVFAAAVILPAGFFHPVLDDSKKMSKPNRELLREVIEQNALAWAVATASNTEIDEINILNASFLAMHRAIDALKTQPEFLLIDGNRFKKHETIPHQCIVKGDSKFMAIAAASVLAKTHRDDYMQGIHEDFPHFHWNQNKGYPTQHHRMMVEQYGHSVHHRKTFVLKNKQAIIQFP